MTNRGPCTDRTDPNLHGQEVGGQWAEAQDAMSLPGHVVPNSPLPFQSTTNKPISHNRVCPCLSDLPAHTDPGVPGTLNGRGQLTVSRWALPSTRRVPQYMCHTIPASWLIKVRLYSNLHPIYYPIPSFFSSRTLWLFLDQAPGHFKVYLLKPREVVHPHQGSSLPPSSLGC